MAQGDALNAALLARIARSKVSLTVQYPPLRPVIITTTTPVSPLTGPKPVEQLVPATPPAPSHAPVTMSCLWLDTPNDLRMEPRRPALKVGNAGWVAGADVLARVAVSDAALNPDDPYAGTVFDACLRVEAHGKHYRVLQVDPIGSSFGVPVSYSLWLAGTFKE